MRRALAWLVLLAGVFASSVLAWQPLLQAVGDFLAVQDPLVNVDAVIAISGNGQERVETASRLLRDGYAPRMILSGGPGRGSGSARQLARYASAVGAPAELTLLDETATSTYTNATGSASVMEQAGLRSAILVTSPYHMRRSIVIFRAVFQPRGLSVRAYPVQESFFRLEGWWRFRPTRNVVVHEYAKLLAFLVGIH